MRMKTNAKSHGLSVLLAAALLLSGCASHSYMGVSLQPGGADPAVQALAVKAQGGDKQAQYELGRWFEDSTDADGLKKAIKLYQIAAIPRGGSRMMYTPGASGVTTSVVSSGPKIEPNRAALDRLALLEAQIRAIKKNTKSASNKFEAKLSPDSASPQFHSLVFGRLRIVRGILESADFGIPQEQEVCKFLTPLYETYYKSKVQKCHAFAYLFKNSRVIFHLSITNEQQLDPNITEYDPIFTNLEGTTMAGVRLHCGQFYVRSVGTRERKYDILIGPAKSGRVNMDLTENGGKCNVRNSD